MSKEQTNILKLIEKSLTKLDTVFKDINNKVKNTSDIIEKTYYSFQPENNNAEEEKNPKNNQTIENFTTFLQNSANFIFELGDMCTKTYGATGSVMTVSTILASQPIVAIGMCLAVAGIGLGMFVAKTLIDKLSSPPAPTNVPKKELKPKEMYKNLAKQNIVQQTKKATITPKKESTITSRKEATITPKKENQISQKSKLKIE